MTTERLQASRATRARREKLRHVMLAVVSVAAVTVIVLLPEGSELLGVAVVVFPITIVGSALAVERDEWHRAHALRAIAIGFAAAVATQVVEAVRVSLDAAHRPSPGRALAIVTVAWLLADFLLRQRTHDES